MPQNEPYNDEFYAKFSEGSVRSARAILPEVFNIVAPKSVADLGCGTGAWLHVAKELGITHVRGFDGIHVNRAALLIADDEFVACELMSEPLLERLTSTYGRFELTLCLEVAEHLPAESARSLINALANMSDVVLFSAAIPFQGGINHINEQWPEYWALQFESLGYICCDCLRERFWANPAVEWWYAQNILLFIHERCVSARRIPLPQSGRGRPLSMVHPLNYICRATAAPLPQMQRFATLSGAWLAPRID